MRTLLALLLLTSCAVTTATKPAETPPPPIRPANAVDILGTVTDDAGMPVSGARISASECDGSNRVAHVTGADGSYELRVEHGVGPESDGCIALEAAAGGAVQRIQRQARFARGSAIRVDLRLPRAQFLTQLDADRLIDLLRRSTEHDADAIAELRLYLPDAPTSLAPMARYTRGIASSRLVDQGDRRFVYELTGRRPGRNVRVTVRQDALTRIELPGIDE